MSLSEREGFDKLPQKWRLEGAQIGSIYLILSRSLHVYLSMSISLSIFLSLSLSLSR